VVYLYRVALVSLLFLFLLLFQLHVVSSARSHFISFHFSWPHNVSAPTSKRVYLRDTFAAGRFLSKPKVHFYVSAAQSKCMAVKVIILGIVKI